MVSTQTIIQTVHEKLLRTKKNESILIICDKGTKELAKAFFEYGYGFGSKTLCFEIPVGSQNGEEPPVEVAEMFSDFDILLLITTKSLSHTNARKKATKAGKRIITIPTGTIEMLKRCIPIDYKVMTSLHGKIQRRLEKAKKVRITTKLGTDISFKVY